MKQSENSQEKNKLSILVVEDDWLAMNMCVKNLYTLGYTDIKTATNGKDALDLMFYTDAMFDLIILDLNMPEINGIEFIEEIHKLKYSGRLIIVSGEDESLMEVTFDMAAEKGIQIMDALPKPINVEYLKKLLAQIN